MIKRRRFPKIFFGWWTVLAGGILSIWGFGYYYQAGTAMFKSIASELGISRAATSVAASIGRLEGGFEAPVAGWIIDRFGPRWVIFFGVFLIGLGLILMNYINSLWAYYVVWGAITSLGVNIAMGTPLQKAITDWFVKKRGLAQGIRWTFTGLAPALMLPFTAHLVTTQGWRMTCVMGGVVMLVVGLPLVWFCFKRYRPEYYGLLPDGATTEAELEGDTSRMIDRGVKYAAEVEEVEFTLRQAMRTPAFWLLIVAAGGQGMVTPAILIHAVPFVTDMGIDPVRAAAIIGMMSIGMIPAGLAGGFLADRVKKAHLRFLIGGAYLLLAAGITAFLLNQTIAMVYVLFFLYYVSLGLNLSPNSVMRARYFGRKAFGSITGISMIFMTPVGVAAPIYAGWVYDTTGSYITAFTLFVGLLVFSAVVMSLVRPPKPPAQITDIHKFL